MSETDLQLLARYVKAGAEDAFAKLVHRHLNLVYSAALRQVRSPQLAEEVAQAVFVDLSRNARQLRPDTIVTAWLYAVTRRTAIDVVRRESRRQLREQIAIEMNAMNATTGDWKQIEPLLDEAVSALDDTDRAAVLLRYFENKSLREVGAALGTSDDAAQKRVSRAVERLREFFTKRGATVGASGLVVVISANAVQAAPVGLAVTISTAAGLAGTTLATTATVTATKTIAMTTVQKILVTATVVVLAGAGIYEARQAATLRDQVQTLRHEQAPLTAQIQGLQKERDDVIRQLVALRQEDEKLRSDAIELLKLRAEVARLRGGSQELAQLNSLTNSVESAAKLWLARVNLLKQRLEETPQAGIPELQLLSPLDWLEIANTTLETEADYRRTLAKLRNRAENYFVRKVQPALYRYMQAHQGKWPSAISELQPYFSRPVDDTILQRWEIVPGASLPHQKFAGDWVITEKLPVDEDYDQRTTIDGPFSAGSGPYHSSPDNESDLMKRILEPVIKAYSAANEGKEPRDLSQLQPFITTPDQRKALEEIIRTIDAKMSREQ